MRQKWQYHMVQGTPHCQFAAVVKLPSVSAILANATSQEWEIH
jgi:hypothetical protein